MAMDEQVAVAAAVDHWLKVAGLSVAPEDREALVEMYPLLRQMTERLRDLEMSSTRRIASEGGE